MTLKFKKEHEDKLKRLKIRTEFVKELKTSFKTSRKRSVYYWSLYDFMKAQEHLDWYTFLSRAFNFRFTVRGFEFWDKARSTGRNFLEKDFLTYSRKYASKGASRNLKFPPHQEDIFIKLGVKSKIAEELAVIRNQKKRFVSDQKAIELNKNKTASQFIEREIMQLSSKYGFGFWCNIQERAMILEGLTK